jgi:hypothetical protein
MTFAEEIRERKATLGEDRNAQTMNTDLLVNALEVRILELGSDLDNAHEDLENEKALTKKLKGLLDGGMVELVGELLESLENFKGLFDNPIARRRYSDDQLYAAAIIDMNKAIAKAKESMP